MIAQANSASGVRSVFRQWGESIRIISRIGAIICVLISIIIAGRSAEPMFAKLASVVVVGIVPALALMALSIVARACLWMLSLLYDRAEPHVLVLSGKGWKQGVLGFSTFRTWTAYNLPLYWRAVIHLLEQGRKFVLAAPAKLLFWTTAPIRFAARTAIRVAPSLA